MTYPDAYDISKRMFELWMYNSDKHSGEIDKKHEEIKVYAADGATTYRVIGVRYDHNRGIMLDLL